MTITRVWIEEGCICCQACVTSERQVFSIPDGSDSAIILGDVRLDGVSDRNVIARGDLTVAGTQLSDTIEEAAEGCPMDIIRFTTIA
ncbi:MAG: ferredoxin [Planctomycetes bacterium]|nr:ferredoxin [Planctomycetota bacterium]